MHKNVRVAASLAAIMALSIGLSALTPAAAQDSGRSAMRGVFLACRSDWRQYCREVPRGGGEVLECLQDHAAQLSQSCKAQLQNLDDGLMARESAKVDLKALPAGIRVLQNFAYGPDPAQTLDVYAPDQARHAPIIVMLHGGAWAFGDKAMQNVVQNKAAHYVPEGYIFVSVDTRLVPAANPLEQAEDMAHALAAVQAHAKEWGGDPNRLVLMGHSAGAHVVDLLTAAPEIAKAAGAGPWRATISLDSGALDVPQIMEARHFKLYDRAFGSDADFWVKVSPTQRLKAASVPILLVCSTRRSDSCPQSKAFAAKDERLGGRAQVLPEDMSHLEINRDLGLPGDYTAAVDRFLNSAGMAP